MVRTDAKSQKLDKFFSRLEPGEQQGKEQQQSRADDAGGGSQQDGAP